MANFNRNKSIFGLNNALPLIFIISISALIFIKIKNSCSNVYSENEMLYKKKIYHANKMGSLNSIVVNLRRSDRIRKVAESELEMYYPEPESLDIIIES